ncbi:MAG: NAD(P)-binding domain-containing protein [Rhodobacteraceae bacterium]|nr:NAD(P)-binding domain-containing protein [Paracoccaceae bacterium]
MPFPSDDRGRAMRIGILGACQTGGRLGTILARAGHEVVFSHARSRDKLERLAREAGPTARAGTPAEAAGADPVLPAVHWSRLDDVPEQAGDLAGRIVLTCSLAMSEDDSHLVIGHTSSGPEALAARLPGAKVVAAFNTVPGELPFPVFEASGRTALPPDLIRRGDGPAAKARVAELIAEVGFKPVGLGKLRTARHMEPSGLVISLLACGGDGGPELGCRFLRVPRE